MARPRSPSMPTQAQIEQAFAVVRALHPEARIKKVGPDGVEFDYPPAPERQERAGWGAGRSSRAGA